MKKLLVISDYTSHGNAKEFSLSEDFKEELLDPTEELLNTINQILKRNQSDSLDF